jgi:hypothetical protein
MFVVGAWILTKPWSGLKEKMFMQLGEDCCKGKTGRKIPERLDALGSRIVTDVLFPVTSPKFS